MRLRQAIDGLQDVPATAVVGGDGQRQPGVAGGASLAGVDQLPQARLEARQIADDLQADAVLVQACPLRRSSAATKRFIRNETSSGGRRQFSELKANTRQIFDAALDAGLDHVRSGLDAALVAGDARHEALASPSGRCHP